MGLADPHCHTTASDAVVGPAELVAAAVAARLDLIAITDHDTMAGAREVWERGRDAGLEVVRGEEVTTAWPAQTHVLGWFLERPVPAGRSLAYTVDAIHAQGGLAVIPHPFMPTYFASCQPAMLARLIDQRSVDGLEVVHTAPTTRRRQRALEAFYEAHRERVGARLAGSDSHFGRHDLGRVLVFYPGRSAEDFHRAVVERSTDPRAGRRPPPPPLRLRARQQVRSLVGLPLRRLHGDLR
ncbi:MAG: PHP domain-containing protein [Candidatus Dormibacteraceae bacterium]